MKQIELTSKLVLAIVGLAAVSAIIIPTYAVPAITSADIVNETIQSVDIKNGEVKTEDLASGAVKPNIHRVESDPRPAPPGGNTIVNVQAICPDGEIATGGGYETNFFDVQVADNEPIGNGRGWLVIGTNTGTGDDRTITAYAVCMGPNP